MCQHIVAEYQTKMGDANAAAAVLRSAKLAHPINSAPVENALRLYTQKKNEALEVEGVLRAEKCTYTKIAFVPV